MPRGKNSRLKNPELYDKLRDDGASKEKAARISKAAGKQGRAASGQKGGEIETVVYQRSVSSGLSFSQEVPTEFGHLAFRDAANEDHDGS